MKQVYILKRHYDYEGYDILGVFDTLRLALIYQDKVMNSDYSGDDLSVDTYIINEFDGHWGL